MNHTVKVLLHWLVTAPTGQSPRGERFSRPARFDHQGDDWTSNAWSLVINTEGTLDARGNQMATAKFLVADAPHEWLAAGRRFTLFEGNLALADGVVKDV